MGLQRAVALLAVVVLLVVACTQGPPPLPPDAAPEEPPSPAPPSGLEVGVVLPPGDPEVDRQLQDLRTELAGLGSILPEGISELRTVLADGRAFVPDVAGLLARQGTDLVCVIGPDARRVVFELAQLYPQLRYCATPASSEEPPEGVMLIDVRFEELGHVVGVAAAAAAGNGVVGAVIGSDRTGRSAFLAGLEAAVGERRLQVHEPASVNAAEAAVREFVDDEVGVIVVDVGEAGVEVLALAVEQALVLGPRQLFIGSDAAGAAVASWRVRWSSVLQLFLAQLVDSEAVPPASVGLADESLELSLGQAATATVGFAVERAMDEIRDGVRDPLAPLHEEEPEQDEEDEAGDEDDEQDEAAAAAAASGG